MCYLLNERIGMVIVEQWYTALFVLPIVLFSVCVCLVGGPFYDLRSWSALTSHVTYSEFNCVGECDL